MQELAWISKSKRRFFQLSPERRLCKLHLLSTLCPRNSHNRNLAPSRPSSGHPRRSCGEIYVELLLCSLICSYTCLASSSKQHSVPIVATTQSCPTLSLIFCIIYSFTLHRLSPCQLHHIANNCREFFELGRYGIRVSGTAVRQGDVRR